MRRWRSVGAAALLAVTACGDEPLSPTSLAGTFSATTFTFTMGAQSVDVLASGGVLIIEIFTDGTTDGVLFLPAALVGTDFTESMVGTYTIAGSTVQFQQSADTFVRNIIFEASGTTTLRGVGTFNGITVRVTLTES
jgi:hypothetical protein